MKANNVQDEKTDAVQLGQDQDATKVQDCPPPKTNDLTRPATNETKDGKPPVSQNADEPYSIYSQKTKTFLIISVSFMGIISPLSSAVYLPAVPQIGHDLNVSPSLINLTITTYMVRFPSFFYTSISMKANGIDLLDISRHCPILHWNFFRYLRTSACLCYMWHYISSGKHWAGSE